MKAVLEDMTQCVGCTACSHRCPSGCITMVADEEGFLSSQIDQTKCTDCRTCRRVCPVLNNNPQPFKKKAFAAWSPDDALRMNSSSGGMFSVIASEIIQTGGHVFGAAFREDFSVAHRSSSSLEGLDALRRSKYVQSDMGQAFKEAESLLKSGVPVLFSGTPCQIAGFRSFLRKDYDQLLTLDIACHGVPSPKVWSMYLDYMKNRFKSTIQAVSFRNKENGWTKAAMAIAFQDGRHYSESLMKDPYFNGFGKSLFTRNSCFDCQFRHARSAADITLADFWGIEKLVEKDEAMNRAIADNKGISLVLANTEKGRMMVLGLQDKVLLREKDYDAAIAGNPRLVSSSARPKARTAFFRDLSSGQSFEKLAGRYMNATGLKQRIINLLKSILSPKLVARLNKMRTH